MEVNDVVRFDFRSMKKKIPGLIWGRLGPTDGDGTYVVVKVTKMKYHLSPLCHGGEARVRRVDRDLVDFMTQAETLRPYARVLETDEVALLHLVA